MRPRPASGVSSTFADRRLAAEAFGALISANVRYWTAVAPLVCMQLRHWERRARAISDPDLRALALEKLRAEGFTAEAAAMLATVAPRAYRRCAVEAIVALEIMYDYLDGRTEQLSPEPLANGELPNGELLYRAFQNAIEPDVQGESARGGDDETSDAGYVRELSRAVKGAIAQLPASAAIADTARARAMRGVQAQIRMHAIPHVGAVQLEDWAKGLEEGSGLEWRETLAGAASSVISLHALIAAAADERTTATHARDIDRYYLSISALSTLLDSLVDYEGDIRDGKPVFIECYTTPGLLARALGALAEEAATRAPHLLRRAHHAMVLVGVVAYFTSAPGAGGDLARPIAADLHAQLRPLIGPTLAIMRAWRLLRRVRQRLRACARRGLRQLGLTT